jgi:ADP-dependent NAD(P)H-hydrate dehydratase / NAD(P)H-hydrate epimerase
MVNDPVYRVADVRSLEAAAAGQPLMQRAGLAAAEVARELVAGRSPRVLVLAGPGNNGGDGFVVARWLKTWFFDVEVAFAGDASRLGVDAATALRDWVAAGGETCTDWNRSDDWGLIVDGMFGIGLTRTIDAPYSQWIADVNAAGVPVLALDIPSGLDADTGCAQAATIRARATATFIALKPGLLTADGPDHCGAISVHALDLTTQTLLPARGERLMWDALRKALPQPLHRARSNVHKGSFGTLAIIGGSDGTVGAALLAGRSALYLGAGKVYVGLASTAAPAVDELAPELMLRDAQRTLEMPCDALVVGPGLGTDARARGLVARALASDVPIVVDADALNLIAGDAALASALSARTAPSAITPHPGEAARLAQCSTAAIQVDRLGAAQALATRYNAATVLKGAGSVLTFTNGSWAINASGNAGLASGGTGDVLSGMLGALLAQGIAVDDALKLAVNLHGAAADALVAGCTGPLGLIASELAPAARTLLNCAARDCAAAA